MQLSLTGGVADMQRYIKMCCGSQLSTFQARWRITICRSPTVGNIHELFAGAATWMSACVVSICSRNSDEGDNSVLDMRSTEKKEERGAMCEEVISA